MSIKSKVLAAAATLTLVSGVGAAGALTAGTANAATPSCGPDCVNIFSNQYGTHKSPNFAVDVLRQGNKVGQPIILFRTANFDPALDWSVAFQGQVSTFAAADLVGTGVSLHYGGGCAYEVPITTAGTATTRLLWRKGALRSSRTTPRSRSSTRRSAWTVASAWASPRPHSATRA